MNRTIVARLLRVLLVGGGVALVLFVVAEGSLLLFGPGPVVLLVPFVAMGLVAIALAGLMPRLDVLVGRLTNHRVVTPYTALAAAAARIRAGSLEQALPGLAQIMADGTGAVRAMIWLAVGDRLVVAAEHPPAEPGSAPDAEPNLAVLLARPDIDHVVPVLEGTVLRAALTIGKPGAAVTPSDQLLITDIAHGAELLLRGVAVNAELADRVRRADDLAGELQASRQRLARAREVERRRLVMELANATTDRLAGLRTAVSAARADLDPTPSPPDPTPPDPGADATPPDPGADAAAPDPEADAGPDPEAAQQALERARVGLDELLDRFRVIARGVYPAVLRDQGPAAALDEVATDLPRPVRLSGDLGGRLDWEIESGLYYVVAAAMSLLADRPADTELSVQFERVDGRVWARIDDPDPDPAAAQLRTGLAVEAERLAALGGELELTGLDSAGRPLVVRAWLPDRLEPVVESSVGAELRVR